MINTTGLEHESAPDFLSMMITNVKAFADDFLAYMLITLGTEEMQNVLTQHENLL